MALWVRRFHLYAGLLSVSALIVYSAAGLVPTFVPEGGGTGVTETVRFVPFVTSARDDPKALADRVHAELDLPLTERVARRAVRKNSSRQWRMRFYTPNGSHEVTVLT